MRVIPIVFSTDDNYVLPLAVAIKSLLDKKSKKDEYKIYVFHDELSEESKRKIKSVCGKTFLEFVCVASYLEGTNFYAVGHVSVATYYRFFIPKILGEYDKVLYLDCDILINGDVGKLYDVDMGDNILAGNRMLGGDAQVRNYFNAGILLFNVKEYLKNGVCEKCVQYMADNKDLEFPDEQTLNAVCFGKVVPLPFKYNFQTWYCTTKELLEKTRIKRIKDITIIHYSSKPWRDDATALGHLWWKKVDTLNEQLKEEAYAKYGQYSKNKRCFFSEYYFASPLGKLVYKIRKKLRKNQNG